MDIWYSSDMHFGHNLMIRKQLRPFSSTDEMDEFMIDRWNSYVSQKDEVWLLGDIAMRPMDKSLPCVGALNGNKILVPGNHDWCWLGHDPRPSYRLRWQMEYCSLAGLTQVVDLPDPHEIAGAAVDLSHFPYEADHTDPPRHMDWRLKDTGDWLLCGHVHELWRQHHRQINVGVDAWDLRPVHIDEIAEMIRSGPQEDPIPILESSLR